MEFAYVFVHSMKKYLSVPITDLRNFSIEEYEGDSKRKERIYRLMLENGKKVNCQVLSIAGKYVRRCKTYMCIYRLVYIIYCTYYKLFFCIFLFIKTATYTDLNKQLSSKRQTVPKLRKSLLNINTSLDTSSEKQKTCNATRQNRKVGNIKH